MVLDSLQTMWAQKPVCGLFANNVGSFAAIVGPTSRVFAANVGRQVPLFAGQPADDCGPLHISTVTRYRKPTDGGQSSPNPGLNAILFVAAATGTMLMPQALPDGLALGVRLVTQIPIVIRIATPILVSYLLTLSIVGMLWNSTSTFRPVLIREVACWQENLLGSMASWKESRR